jgi:type IV pilus assembly protein PilM
MQKPLNGYGVLDDHHLLAAEELAAELLAEQIAADFQAVAPDEPLPREAMLPPLPITETGWEARRLRAAAREITQALSVAAAYFEDTLQVPPGVVLAAGTVGAEMLGELLREAGFDEAEMRVRELVEPAMLVGGAVTSRVPRGWMASVRGALRG